MINADVENNKYHIGNEIPLLNAEDKYSALNERITLLIISSTFHPRGGFSSVIILNT